MRPIQVLGENLIYGPLLRFLNDDDPIRDRVDLVLQALPEEVLLDFLNDDRFQITREQHVPGTGRTVVLAEPGPVGEGSRSVVLRPHLAQASEAFAAYVIAHELAHAFLRNGGWGEITDAEQAADALAARWGFPRPERFR